MVLQVLSSLRDQDKTLNTKSCHPPPNSHFQPIIFLAGYTTVMSTLVEIEQATLRLTTAERQQMLFALARGLRQEQALPPPRQFSIDEMTAWMDEDEAAFRALKTNA